ncbi:non-ribosomal peptide synthetase [Tahibacter sp.]|uniref:non-ribosomal peptide synthetase n=1 Tax=Tahibacter sp. TaxID=2056211 RepID=UPI0028C50F20|nr:non-ribosomal peptide synthetase [Tahibacter sp.]
MTEVTAAAASLGATLIDRLREHVRRSPDGPAFTFLRDGLEVDAVLSWRNLWDCSAALARLLRAQGFADTNVLLAFPAGLEFIVAFVGCLMAGAVAVPMPVPRKPAQWQRLAAMQTSGRLDAVLVAGRDRAAFLHSPLAELPLFDVDLILPAQDDTQIDWPLPGADALAFLQYTSGSTAQPRGVRVSHANILANQRRITAAFATHAHSVGVSWLPMFHDMGLIGTVLNPIYAGFHMALLAPAAFLRQPECWLRAIARFRATVSGAPSFAYRLCVERFDRCSELDLSTWSVAFCGAERIDASVAQAFVERFADNGLSAEAFVPCYGLAEATLFVSGGPPRRRFTLESVDTDALAQGRAQKVEAGQGTALVGCGHVVGDDAVAIVEAASGVPLGARRVGEIWVRGPSVAAGYVGQPAGDTGFGRTTADGRGDWLATGDLGYLDEHGELFVCGRRKELVIVRGRNFYPHDIEQLSCLAVPALEPTACAAVAAHRDGQECIGLVAEWKRGAERDEVQATQAIRAAIGAAFDVAVPIVRLVRPGSLPRTTSGKLQRGQIAVEWTGDNVRHLPARQRQMPQTSSENALAAAIEAQGVPHEIVDFAASAAECGLDSLGVHRVQSWLLERRGLCLDAAVLISAATLAEAAANVMPFEAAADARVTPFVACAMSANQRALWLDHLQRPQSAESTLCLPLQWAGSLSCERIEQAFAAFLKAHPLLRMTIPAATGRPEWQLPPQPAPAFFVHTGVDACSLISSLANAALDPSADALFRLHYLADDGGDHVIVQAHHLVADATSLIHAVRELMLRYAARDVPASASFANYETWQSDRLASHEGEKAQRYWRDRLADFPARVEWPGAAHPAAAAGTARRLAPSVHGVAAIRRLAHRLRHADAALAVLVAAVGAVVCRWTGQPRVAICVPLAGRPARFAGTQGYCVEPVPVIVDVSRCVSFDVLVADVRAQCASALVHSYAAASPRISAAADPLQILVNFLPSLPTGIVSLGRDTYQMQPWTVRVREPAFAQRRHHYAVTMMTSGDSLTMAVDYRADVMSEAIARAMTDSLCELLANPSADAADVRDDVVVPEQMWSVQRPGPPVAARDGVGWIGALWRQVERQPTATALVCDGVSIDYATLYGWAMSIATQLKRCGVRREQRVGVMMRRSPALVAGLLAVLLADAAYVPIDPSYPAEYIAQVVADARPVLVLTDADTELPQVLRSLPSCAIDADAAVSPALVAPGPVAAEQVAYVIYTSGSTGVPKGVCIRHGAVEALLQWAREFYAPHLWQGLAATTSICFDLSIFEIFGTLFCGGSLHLHVNALTIASDASHLRFINTVPSALRELLLSGNLPASVEVVNVAGEPLPEQLAPMLRASHPTTQLFNLYGPTEDTTYSTVARIDGAAGAPTIGHVLPGSEAWILDTSLRPVPVGGSGELYLAGCGLARGYLAAPARTAERFLPHPFARQSGERLYRTGDLARLLPDGRLDLRGRNDQQIKLRGFRIELGEIVSALQRLAGVEAAAVIHHLGDGGSTAHIAAFVQSQVVCGSDLRRQLALSLPGHMVPQTITVLALLPLGPNGKVDRNALAALQVHGPKPAADDTLSPTERLVAGLWEQLLGHRDFDTASEFFAVGGHSLLVLELARAIGRECGVQLDIARLFSARTLAAQAGAIDRFLAVERLRGKATDVAPQGMLEL